MEKNSANKSKKTRIIDAINECLYLREQKQRIMMMEFFSTLFQDIRKELKKTKEEIIKEIKENGKRNLL